MRSAAEVASQHIILIKKLSLVRASEPFLNSVISSGHCGHKNRRNKTKTGSTHSSFRLSGGTTRAVAQHKAESNHQSIIHQRAQGSSHVHLSIASRNACSKSAVKTTRLFVRDQRPRLPSRATMNHSRVSKKLIERAHTPRHQNTKCLVRANRAGGSRQHDCQVVRFQDAFSVALRRQMVGSDKLDPSAQKGQQAQRPQSNQPEHQQNMP